MASFGQHSGNCTGGGLLPNRLKERDQWMVTKNKRPVVPSEGWQCSENQLSFADAEKKAKEIGGGLGFVFCEDDPFVGFDLDDVQVDDAFTDEALEIVRQLWSYTETSSSGSGLHVIAEGEHLDEYKHRGDLSERGHLEVYDTGRYFILTGNVVDDFDAVNRRRAAVEAVQREHLSRADSNTSSGRAKSVEEQQFAGTTVGVDPEDVRETIRVYADNEDYDVDDTALRLWGGSDAGYSGDASRADMAFVRQLYYWCKGDARLMDSCFRSSRRMRDKWDKVHYSDGDTYGERVIHKVCRTGGNTFGGRYVK